MSQDNIPWNLDPARTHKGMGPLESAGEAAPTLRDPATYRLGSRLGLSGNVYEAHESPFAKRTAIKLFPFATGLPQAVMAAFAQDAARVAQLHHPHIAQVLDAGVLADGTPFLAMERLAGRTLEELLEGRGALPVSELLPVIRGVASALSAAHAVGVVHRELRPDNVFITNLAGYELGFVKLLDFGASRLCAAARAVGRIVGPRTIETLAPEQRQGGLERADERTDQFALALLTYRLLTGVDAFPGQESGPGFERLRETQLRPSNFFVRCAPAVDAVLCKALSRRPENRFDSVDLFFRATEDALAGTSLIQTPVPVLLTTPIAPSLDRRQNASPRGRSDGRADPTLRLDAPGLGRPAAFVRGPGPARASNLDHPATPPRETMGAREGVSTRQGPGDSSLTHQFFAEGEHQEAIAWKTSPLLEERPPDNHAREFDSFDKVPKKRSPRVIAAFLVVAGLGIAAWAAGSRSQTDTTSVTAVGTAEPPLAAPSPRQPLPAAVAPAAIPQATASPAANMPVANTPGAAMPAANTVGSSTPAANTVGSSTPAANTHAAGVISAAIPAPKAGLSRGREVVPRLQRRPEPLRGYVWSPNQGGLTPAHLAPLPSESPPPPLGDSSSPPAAWSSPPASPSAIP